MKNMKFTLNEHTTLRAWYMREYPKDEMGKDLTICFDAFNFLEWVDKEQIDYIKQKVIEYVENK